MNTDIEAVRRKLADLQERVEKLKAFLAAWDDVAPILDGDSPQTAPPPHNGGSETQPVDNPDITPVTDGIPMPKRTRVTDNPKPSVVIDAAIRILLQHGRPMSRRELHEALSGEGLVVRGADPIKALGTMLWRGNDRLESIEGRGYWPKGHDLPRDTLSDLLG